MTAPLSSFPESLRNLRPKERVQLFFKNYIEQHVDVPATRLPTIKEISKHLEVSIFTVQSVVGQLAKEGLVVTTPGKGTFLNVNKEEVTASSQSLPIITVSIHQNELVGKESTWGKEICAGVMHGISGDTDRMMMMRPFFVDIDGANTTKVAQEASHSSVLIVFPSRLNSGLIRAFQDEDKPVIHITAPGAYSLSNFVSPDFYITAYRVGAVWRETGRRHVLLLLHAPIVNGSDLAQSLAGMEAALSPEGNFDTSPKLTYHCIEAGNRQAVDELLHAIYASSIPPDAIYSTSDTIAFDAALHLLNRGVPIPEQVSIVGGTGLNLPQPLPIPCTVVEQPFEAVGQAAAVMALAALDAGNQPQVGHFIPTNLRLGKTTREAENLALQKVFTASSG